MRPRRFRSLYFIKLCQMAFGISSRQCRRAQRCLSSINRDSIAYWSLFLPSPEQKRIVAILDEAFVGLATATANAEKNLKNARELFESSWNLVLGKEGEHWPVQRLEEVVDERCSLSYGIVQPGDEKPNGLPIVRPVDIDYKDYSCR